MSAETKLKQPVKTGTTPMIAQFLSIKADYPDALLFYRMGDFYELFFDDAVKAAAALDIALTKRGKHDGEDIPMCGVPFHAAENYLNTLIHKGFRVAVCEQLEKPAEAKKRGAKSVVKRGVVRLVTPGTLTEDALLDARKHNFLAAFGSVGGHSALAWVDVSIGNIMVRSCKIDELETLLARLQPSELLIPEGQGQDIINRLSEIGYPPHLVGKSSFDSTNSNQHLCKFYGVKTLDAFGQFERPHISALGAVLNYLELTQIETLPRLSPPQLESETISLQIDAATRKNLEITHSLNGGRKGSLLSTIDFTVTNGGARLFEARLTNPITDKLVLNERQDAIAYFFNNPSNMDSLINQLKTFPDIARALSRVAMDRAGPRDLCAIATGLDVATTLAFDNDLNTGARIKHLQHTLSSFDKAISEYLKTTIIEQPPLLQRDGGFIQTGYHSELDELRNLRDQGKSVIATMQSNYSDISGINSLKIKHNNVLGYFIETPASYANKMMSEPLSDSFIHRQTTANAVRFTTIELSELETKMHNASSHALQIEKDLFQEIRQEILAKATEITDIANAVAELDVYISLSYLAKKQNWTRPTLTSNRAFEIKGGRHPVVEASLKSVGEKSFIPNDCDLSAEAQGIAPICLLTGPNMAGKSTFLRQNALIGLLAQIGSYVPAKQATIGIISQIFSRVGAADDLARGRSTFMVEMVETAAILNQADERALVILDEIGRGTATYDGLSIAWACVEQLHNVNRCRTIFATHYHELTSLASKLDKVTNATVTVKEWKGDIIFLHEVKKGAADRSYGVQVAKLAGLPQAVIDRAKLVLEKLETDDRKGKNLKGLVEDLPLFSAPPAPIATPEKPNEVEIKLTEIYPDDLSPREALAMLYSLKELANKPK